jgi:myo-inositol-1(or 4)-monophosphatase
MAAGALMVVEAGGIVTDFFGGDAFLTSGNIIAGSLQIHKEISERTNRAFTRESVAGLANNLF